MPSVLLRTVRWPCRIRNASPALIPNHDPQSRLFCTNFPPKPQSDLTSTCPPRVVLAAMAQESPTPSGTATPNHTVNLEELDFGHPTPHHPRPFKSAPTKHRAPRRNKNLKQILQDEQKALAALAALTADPADATNGNAKTSVRGKLGRTLRVEGLQWGDIDAPPSLLPPKKFCDITGLEGKYTDPKTKLRYHNTEVYAVIQTLPASVDQEYLALRSANVVLK